MRWGPLVVAAASCVAVVAPGTASASRGHEFAVGSGKNRLAEFTPFPFDLQVSAHRHRSGDVTGHVRGYGELPLMGEFWVEGEVTCVNVVPKPAGDPTGPGYRAAIKYRFKNRRGPGAPPPGGVEVYIEDNGNPPNGQPVDGNGTGPPQPEPVFEAQAGQCSDPNIAGEPYNPLDAGNYTLHDDITP